MTDTFDLIAVQRRAVADVLDSLSAEEWLTPSLCEGWRVQEMAAHLSMPFRVGNGRFLLKVLGAEVADPDAEPSADAQNAPEQLKFFVSVRISPWSPDILTGMLCSTRRCRRFS